MQIGYMFMEQAHTCTETSENVLVGVRTTSLIWGEHERAPNTRETESSVYIYLFVRDLAW